MNCAGSGDSIRSAGAKNSSVAETTFAPSLASARFTWRQENSFSGLVTMTPRFSSKIGMLSEIMRCLLSPDAVTQDRQRRRGGDLTTEHDVVLARVFGEIVADTSDARPQQHTTAQST